MVLVHMGTVQEGAQFLKKRWPGARAVADPEKATFSALGLVRASASQVLGLRVWKEFFKVARHGIGKPVGDPLILAGSFVVRGREVLAAEPAEHVGDLPDYDALAEVALAASAVPGVSPERGT